MSRRPPVAGVGPTVVAGAPAPIELYDHVVSAYAYAPAAHDTHSIASFDSDDGGVGNGDAWQTQSHHTPAGHTRGGVSGGGGDHRSGAGPAVLPRGWADSVANYTPERPQRWPEAERATTQPRDLAAALGVSIKAKLMKLCTLLLESQREVHTGLKRHLAQALTEGVQVTAAAEHVRLSRGAAGRQMYSIAHGAKLITQLVSKRPIDTMESQAAEDIVLRLTNLYRLAADQLDAWKTFPHPRLIEAISHLHTAATLAHLADGAADVSLETLLQECSHVDVTIQFPTRKPEREWNTRHHVTNKPTVPAEFTQRAQLRLDGGDRADARIKAQVKSTVFGFARARSAVDRRNAREGPAFRRPNPSALGPGTRGKPPPKRRAPTRPGSRKGATTKAPAANKRPAPRRPATKNPPRQSTEPRREHKNEAAPEKRQPMRPRKKIVPARDSAVPTTTITVRPRRPASDVSEVKTGAPMDQRAPPRHRPSSQSQSNAVLQSGNGTGAPAAGRHAPQTTDHGADAARHVAPTPGRASLPMGRRDPLLVYGGAVNELADESDEEEEEEEGRLHPSPVAVGGTIGQTYDGGRATHHATEQPHSQTKESGVHLDDILDRLDALQADRDRIRKSWGCVRYADVPPIDREDARVAAATVTSIAALPLSSDYSIVDEFGRIDRGHPSVFDVDQDAVGEFNEDPLGFGRDSRRPQIIRVTNDDSVPNEEPCPSVVAKVESGRVMGMSSDAMRRILDYKAAFEKHVNITSLCNTDEVSPWTVVSRVGEDVLDGCLVQVCQEVFAEFDATVDGLVAAETALS